MSLTPQIVVLTFLIWVIPACVTADCKAFDLESVLAATAIEPPKSVQFREERHNPMLKEPMVLTGTMEYIEPGKLRKRVETPFLESYLAEPDQVSIERDGKVEVIRGRRGKFIAGLLGGIESVLAGDAKSLEDTFEVRLEGNRDAWSLKLVPHSDRLARHMQSLVVTGNTESVEVIRVQLDDEFHVMEMIHEPGSEGT